MPAALCCLLLLIVTHPLKTLYLIADSEEEAQDWRKKLALAYQLTQAPEPNAHAGRAAALRVRTALQVRDVPRSADRLLAHGQLSTATCHTPPVQRCSG